MDNSTDILQKLNSQMQELINDSERVRPVTTDDLGMSQMYGTMYVDTDTNDLIAPASMFGQLSYYAGFEYIDDEHIQRLGNWTIYSFESTRIRDLIELSDPTLNPAENICPICEGDGEVDDVDCPRCESMGTIHE